MRVVLVLSVLAVTGCAGMKPVKLFTPSHENRAMVIPGVGGLHRAQYEDSAIGRLQAETLIESHCRGPGAVVADAELQTVSGGGVLLGRVVVPLNSRPAARRTSFTRGGVVQVWASRALSRGSKRGGYSGDIRNC